MTRRGSGYVRALVRPELTKACTHSGIASRALRQSSHTAPIKELVPTSLPSRGPLRTWLVGASGDGDKRRSPLRWSNLNNNHTGQVRREAAVGIAVSTLIGGDSYRASKELRDTNSCGLERSTTGTKDGSVRGIVRILNETHASH